MSNSQKAVKARRQSVWLMLTKGMQQKDIAKQIEVSDHIKLHKSIRR
jgi:DNA-binding NarL/FixJ family response regulator